MQVAEQQKEKVAEKLTYAEEKIRSLETENDYLKKRVVELEREINGIETKLDEVLKDNRDLKEKNRVLDEQVIIFQLIWLGLKVSQAEGSFWDWSQKFSFTGQTFQSNSCPEHGMPNAFMAVSYKPVFQLHEYLGD